MKCCSSGYRGYPKVQAILVSTCRFAVTSLRFRKGRTRLMHRRVSGPETLRRGFGQGSSVGQFGVAGGN